MVVTASSVAVTMLTLARLSDPLLDTSMRVFALPQGLDESCGEFERPTFADNFPVSGK